MKKIALAAIASLSLILSGCTEIVYDSSPIITSDNIGEVTSEPLDTEDSAASLDKYQAAEININTEEYYEEFQLEDICDNPVYSYLSDYSGNGYICLEQGEYAVFSVHAPSTQYYKLTVTVSGYSAGLDTVIGTVEESAEGETVFNGVSKGTLVIEEAESFVNYSVNGIYLKKGDNEITLYCSSGTVYIDKAVMENGKSVSDSFYSMGNAPINPNADKKTVKIMSYFAQIYGEKTLTGQYVTSGTNAEIAAIYNETGRLPAIRCSDLSSAQSRSPLYDEEGTDLLLAEQWSELGGLVSYSWTWYSPSDSSHYLSVMTDFDFSKANTDTDISLASMETIEKIYGDGGIPKECYRLIQDIDEMAEVLKELQDNGVTVLFRPLAQAYTGEYWWSESAESYKWLWRTMVKRYNEYFGLTNLIWVWSGGSEEFYPGDEYVDIIGEDIYNFTGDSGNIRFMNTALYHTGAGAAAMTECGMVPDPDILVQDNAKWLWFSLFKGDYLIDENGSLTQRFTSNTLLTKAYNHENFVTLDELPDFSS